MRLAIRMLGLQQRRRPALTSSLLQGNEWKASLSARKSALAFKLST
jgi:hypothetical protein